MELADGSCCDAAGFQVCSLIRANFIDAAPFQRIIRVGEADDLPGSAIA
jgi:hypothetical protein